MPRDSWFQFRIMGWRKTRYMDAARALNRSLASVVLELLERWMIGDIQIAPKEEEAAES